MRVASGDVTKKMMFVAVDSTDLKTRETGLSSFTVVSSRNGAADATYTTPTVTEIDASTMPGVYALLLDEDMTIDAGDAEQEAVVHITATGMAPVTRSFTIFQPVVTAGETLAVASGIGDADVTDKTGFQLTGTYPTLDAFKIWADANYASLPALHSGTAQAGASTSITLEDGASTVANFYRGAGVIITSGTGAGQDMRLITGYDVSTPTAPVATVTPQWATNPDATSVYDVVAAGGYVLTTGGVAIVDGGITAAKIGADAFTAAKFAADVTTEFQSGLATAAALATVDGIVDNILLDTVLTRKAILNQLVVESDGTITLYDDDALTPLKTWAATDLAGTLTIEEAS